MNAGHQWESAKRVTARTASVTLQNLMFPHLFPHVKTSTNVSLVLVKKGKRAKTLRETTFASMICAHFIVTNLRVLDQAMNFFTVNLALHAQLAGLVSTYLCADFIQYNPLFS